MGKITIIIENGKIEVDGRPWKWHYMFSPTMLSAKLIAEHIARSDQSHDLLEKKNKEAKN